MVSSAQAGSRASPSAPDMPGPSSAGESAAGESSPPFEATLDPSTSSATASADAGPSESADAGDADAGDTDAAGDNTAGDNTGDAGDAGPPPSNDCCQTSPAGGCIDATVAACVCAGDPFCCSTEYDDACVTEAISRCDLDCDDRAPTSDCCTPSDVPGCTVPDLRACICAIDPVCCVFRFDQNCVNIGISQCVATCGAAEGGP